MSYIIVVLTSVFSANALLVYGLGACPAFRREKKSPIAQILALGFVSLLASGLFWIVRRFVLLPLSLESISVIVYAVAIAPALKYLSRLVAGAGRPLLVRIGAAADEAVISCLVFGIALIATKGEYNFIEALVASVSACVGYWLAVMVLDSIRERLELSDLPSAFKGAPALLVSAGLMALAFMGVDSVLVHNIAR
jgi:electron transport complex protein RnfA